MRLVNVKTRAAPAEPCLAVLLSHAAVLEAVSRSFHIRPRHLSSAAACSAADAPTATSHNLFIFSTFHMSHYEESTYLSSASKLTLIASVSKCQLSHSIPSHNGHGLDVSWSMIPLFCPEKRKGKKLKKDIRGKFSTKNE